MTSTPIGEQQQVFTDICFTDSPAQSLLDRFPGRDDRLGRYRRMVRSRLTGMLKSGLRRTSAAIGNDAFQHWANLWFEHSPPRTRYIREIVGEFCDFSASHWEKAIENGDSRWPAFATDLAHLERTRWEAAYDPSKTPSFTDFSFEGAPVLNPTLKLLVLSHAVQKVSEEHEYEAKRSHVAVFRNLENDKTAVWSVSERSFEWIKSFQSRNCSVTDHVKFVAEKRQETIDQAYVSSLGSTLAELIQSGLILGGSSL